MGKPTQIIIGLLILLFSHRAITNEPINVLFINPGFAYDFWGNVTATMRAAAEDLQINLEVVNADRDRLIMLDLAKKAAVRDKKPDYVVLVNELQQGEKLVNIFEQAGVLTLFLLNRLSVKDQQRLRKQGKLSRYLGSITPRNTETGYETAKAIIDAARKNKKSETPLRLLALLGDTATPAAIEREAGLRQAVKEAGDVEIVRAISVDWRFDRAKSVVAYLIENQAVDIIWSASGSMAFGAMESVTEAGLKPGKDITFAGIGWFPEVIDAVESKEMTMAYGGYFTTGAWAMVMLRDIHNGLSLQDKGELDSPLAAINDNNIDDFARYIRDIDWTRLNFSNFTRTTTGKPQYDFTSDALFREIKRVY